MKSVPGHVFLSTTHYLTGTHIHQEPTSSLDFLSSSHFFPPSAVSLELVSGQDFILCSCFSETLPYSRSLFQVRIPLALLVSS